MDASNLQTSFLGGEWSPYAQGRVDERDYRIGMNQCVNGYPIEAGAWTRRQGTRFCATTRYGQPGWLLPFWFAESAPYTMEFTNQHLRFFNGPNLVGTNDPQKVLSISAANPAVVTLAANVPGSWSNGDMVYFIFNKGGVEGAKTLFMRQFVIGSISGATFTLTDPISGAGIDGSTITLAPNVSQVIHIQDLASPYTASQLTSINKIQAEQTVVTLAPAVAPQAVIQTLAPASTLFAQFSIGAATFLDGPYLDPNTTGFMTSSATSGSTTLNASVANTFAATDVGRLVRLFSEPAAWASGTAYTTGNVVKYTDGLYYQALANSTGVTPPQNPTDWAVDPTAAIWTWATITAYASGTQVTATINGPALLYSGVNINSYRLGLYSATTGYPTCGVYHEGRLWLAGAKGNRIDSSAVDNSQPAGTFNFKPTESDGTVTDADAISYVFNAEDVDEIFFMQPFNSGIVCGTQGGEWMVAASSLNDPLTPTSIQAHRRSKYKCANIQAVHTGLSIAFVQAQQTKLMEYVADVFSGKMLGRNLTVNAKHLTTSFIQQIAYQQELTPIIWARTGAGQLIGTTYKRESSFTNEPPTFNGWHQHNLGSGRVLESMSVGPNVTGNLESLTIITNQTNAGDNDFGVRHVEILTDMFDENNIITDAWFLDDALTPSAAQENVGATQITFYGYYHLVGKSVSGWIGGVDAGDATVQSDGSVTFPINQPGSLLTDTYLNSLSSTTNFDGLGTYLDRTVNVQYASPSNFTIQSYIPTNVPYAYQDDYLHNTIYSMSSTGSGSIAKFNRFTGVKQLEVTGSTMFAGAPVPGNLSFDPGSSGCFILSPDGQYMFFNGGSANTVPIVKISTANLLYVAQFGVGGGNDNTNSTAVHMADGVVVKTGGLNYLIHIASAFGKLGVLFADGMLFAGHDFNFTEGKAAGICAGDFISSGNLNVDYASAYSMAQSGTQFSLYKTIINGGAFIYSNPPTTTGTPATFTNGAITTTKLVTFTPSQIDAAWTAFTSITAPVYDPSDGNVIFIIYSSGHTNNQYIVKVNSRTGAIVYATAVAAGENAGGSNNFDKSIVQNGLLTWLQETSVITSAYTLNTATGVVTVTAIGGTGTLGSSTSASVDIDGSITSFGGWNGNTLVGVNGTTSFSNAAYRLQNIPAFPGQTTTTQSSVIPAVIGFNYVSTGQRLRDIAPDASGARNGPALGKTRRVHRAAMLLANSQGLFAGADDMTKVHTLKLLSQNGRGANQIANNVLFEGVWTAPLESTYNYDNMMGWQIKRPYPATVCAAGNMIETQDR